MRLDWRVFLARRYVVALFFLAVALLLFLNTGALDPWNIDKRDLDYWEHVDGVIIGGESFEIGGSRDVCWVLIHGYTDSPDSMRIVGERVSREFGDYVYVPRLLGHAEVPSRLLSYTLEDWYSQVSFDVERLEKECEKVNVLGFSFGGALSLKLAEEKDLNNVYLIASYLEPSHKWYYGFSPNVYLKLFSNVFVYNKKPHIPKVNSREWAEGYITYWNFPVVPVRDSEEFLDILRSGIGEVEDPILIQHSRGDGTASFKMSELIYAGVSSEVKDLVLYDESNHVILADYDRGEVVDRVIEFEIENRGAEN